MGKIVANLQTVVLGVLMFSAGIVLVWRAVYGTADALSPRLLGIALPGAYDWIGYAVVFVVWLVLPFVQAKRDAGISISIIRDRAPVRIQRWLDVIRNIAMLALFAVLVWRTGVDTWFSWVTNDTFPATPPLPMYPARLAITIGVGLALVVCLYNLSSQLARFAHRTRESGI